MYRTLPISYYSVPHEELLQELKLVIGNLYSRPLQKKEYYTANAQEQLNEKNGPSEKKKVRNKMKRKRKK